MIAAYKTLFTVENLIKLILLAFTFGYMSARLDILDKRTARIESFLDSVTSKTFNNPKP